MPTINAKSIGFVHANVESYGQWPAEKLKVADRGKSQIIHNPVDRRVKGKIPTTRIWLRDHPTAISLQSRTSETYCEEVLYSRPAVGNKGWFSVTCAYVTGYHPWPSVPTAPSNLYVNGLRNKIKDMAGVNLAEDCFEFRQTASTFTQLTSAVARGYKGYRALRRGDLATAQKYARRPLTKEDIAQAHLAASWGIKPLVETLQEGLIDLNRALMLEAAYWKQFRVKSVWSAEMPGKDVGGGLYNSYTVWKKERACLWVKFRPDSVRQVQFGNGLELGWNLLTLSCIADWFIPVGEALSALDALSGVERMIGTVSTKTHYTRSCWYRSEMWKSGDRLYRRQLNCKQSETKDTYSRAVITTLPGATLPRWRPSLSWRKLSLAVAVLVSQRGGKTTKPGMDPLKPIPAPDVRRLAREAARQRTDQLNGRRHRQPVDPWKGYKPL